MRKRAAITLLACAALAGGCGGGRVVPPTKTATIARDPRFAYARRLFRQICGGCHTLADAGTRGRRFNIDNDPYLNRALIEIFIRDGDFGMPGWEGALTRKEVDALIDYVDAVAQRNDGETGWREQQLVREEGER